VVAQTTDRAIEISLPTGDLADSLDKLGDQSGVQIMYEPALAKGVKAPAVSGTLTVSDALKQLLAHTGLKANRVNDRTVVLKRADAKNDRADRPQAQSPSPSQAEDTTPVIEEIMVTAQKREERLKDVPIPVAVVNTDNLTDTGKVLLKDYYNTVPGLQLTPSYEQNQFITIRGITTGNGAIPTVGFVIDDVPFGSPIAQGSSLPDIDPGDLDRIEVLRGPQGTLYGASSMGGLVKFVTKTPSTDAFSGRVEAGTSTIKNDAEAGFQVRASLNIPVSDNFAVRVSGFRRQEPGYIDDPSLNLKGVNELRSYGGRFSALWKVAENFSITASALYQSDRGNGVSDVTVAPGLGDLQQKFIPNTGPSHRVTQAYSLTIKADLGGFHVVSLTGYNKTRYQDVFDFSTVFGANMQKTFGVSGAPYSDDFQPRNFTEELRITRNFGDKLEWLVGGFLADDTNELRQIAYAENPTTGQIVGVGDDGIYHYKYHEYAFFSDLTYHATDSLSIQIGGRYSSLENVTGPYSIVEPIFTGNTIPVVQNVLDAHLHPATFLVTPQYTITKDVMVYTRIASGFRPGGGNLVFPGVPITFDPDKTYNYEVGLKGDLLNHALSIDASLYYIDWKNIQINERTSTNHGYTGNGGRAKSEGVELSIAGHPWTGFTVSGWSDYDDAVLTNSFPSGATVFGAPGDRLPASPTWSANGSVRQEFPLWSGATGYAGGTVTYVGDRLGAFLAKGLTRQNLPAYTQVDLNIGANWEDGWGLNIYANNLTDKRGVLQGGAGYSIPTSFYFIRPRTVGLSVTKTF
jgi:outer membrane receptor protein involved in Fe transport